MQTWITDKNIHESANNLDLKRLFASIYENIHGLASLLNYHDKLVNPVKNISNKPQCKLWKGYEQYLLGYCLVNYCEWFFKVGYKKNDFYKTVNYQNIKKIAVNFFGEFPVFEYFPDWVTDDLIETHRSVLIQKDPDFYAGKWPGTKENLSMRYDWRINDTTK